MSEPATTRRMSATEYLQWEREQVDKHEYYRGEVFSMAGGSPRHNFLSSAVGSELRASLRGRGCAVLSSDQRVAAQDRERYVYADVVVACGGVQTLPEATDVLTNPAIVVEVLSKRTERYDRGEKWELYQQHVSVTDYVLVAQASVRVEHYQREPAGAWRYQMLGAGETITLTSGATIDIDAIYDGAFALPGD